jgi:hypothetical protein
MKNTIQNLDELNFEKKINRIGYGNFPYLLYKSSPATFTQIPIHLNKPIDLETYSRNSYQQYSGGTIGNL